MPTLKENLKFLYPKEYEETFNKLEVIIEEFKEKNPEKEKKKNPFFSERDVVLICNADHVKESGIKPLVTMNKFLKKYVKKYINSVHFLPFYSWSNDRGFAVDDYYKVKKEYGEWSHIRKISKDFRLMFDLVVNHVSYKNNWFKKFLDGDKYYSDFFIAFDKKVDVSKVFRPRTDPLLKPFKTKMGRKYVWCTFPLEQADLNFSNPEVFLEIVRVLLFYVSKGAQIIREDAIAFIWKKLGTNCLHLPQVHVVVKIMRQVFEKTAPNVWIITETNVPHKDNVSYFGNGNNEAHLVYNFTLPPLLLYTFLVKDSTYFTNWAKKLKLKSNLTTFFNFTASHDGVGVTPLKDVVDKAIPSLVKHTIKNGGVVSFRDIPGKKPAPYELNIVYLSALENNPDKFLASQAIGLALRGVPAIYFNSLIGARNWTAGVKKYKANRKINEKKFNYKKLSKELDDNNTFKNKVYACYTKLLKARTNEPLFSPLAGQKILDFGKDVVAIHRYSNNKNLIAIINITDKKIKLDIGKIKEILGKEKINCILTGQTINPTKDLQINSYKILWLK